MQGLKGAHETLRSFATSTIRRRLFGGATRPSSPVRLTSLTHRLPSRRALLTSCAVCARGRTVLATASEPAHHLGLYARLLFELHALVCGPLACSVAVKSAVVATA